MEFREFYKYKKYYMLGIGGVSMSALSKFLLLEGCAVSGYDEVRGEQTEDLLLNGVRVSFEKEKVEKILVEEMEGAVDK